MKTSIAMDDELVRQADAAARDQGVSRSHLITLALREHLQRRREAQLIEQLNRAYPAGEPQESVAHFKAKFSQILEEENW